MRSQMRTGTLVKRRANVERFPDGRWKPGVVPNPTGAVSDVHVRVLARQLTQRAIATLAAIMCNEQTAAGARVLAAQAILDRGWGRASTLVEDAETVVRDYAQLSDAELDNELHALGIDPKSIVATVQSRVAVRDDSDGDTPGI